MISAVSFFIARSSTHPSQPKRVFSRPAKKFPTAPVLSKSARS
jgi:hypothetical protein